MSSQKKSTTKDVSRDAVVKKDQERKKVTLVNPFAKSPRVQVTDFSLHKVKISFAAVFVLLFFLAIFPYKSVTREHGSYSLLFEHYYKKIQNRFVYAETFSPALGQSGVASSVPIVMYHGVMARPDAYNLHRENFEDHLSALKMSGWQTITMDQFRAFRLGEIDLPEKSFLLTFDDGRKDSYYPVDPLLERFNYSAVMFTLPQYSIDHEEISPYYLNRRHIERMRDSGRWDIESHTWDGHSFFKTEADGESDGIFLANLLWRDDLNRVETEGEFGLRVREDLQKADTSIKALTGKGVTTIAFPFGNYGNTNYNFEGAQDIVLKEAQAIHDLGFSQVRIGTFRGHGLSANYADASDFLVERIDVNPLWSASELLAVLEGGMDKDLPYQADMENYVGWIAPSGVMRHDGDGIVMETSQIHPKAVSFLDGAGLWKDYQFDLDLYWDQGEKIILRTHGDLAEGGVACVYERERMYVVAPGIRSDLVTAFYEDATTRGPIEISAGVSLDGGFCRIGKTELSFSVDELLVPLSPGTVSVEVHDGSVAASEGNVLTRLLERTSGDVLSETDDEKGIVRLMSYRAIPADNASVILQPLTSVE